MSRGTSEKALLAADKSSVYLAMEIMEYAHKDQKRENGEEYANHPARCLVTYRDLIGLSPEGNGNIDEDLICRYRVPFKGVQEVCLLHDVVEDTEFTLEDIKDIYTECGLEEYFIMYIEDALTRITHDKTVDYADYIKICLRNPISALVKMLDLNDNLNVLSLTRYDEERYHRAQGYLFYTLIINDAYHFVECANEYRNALNEDKLLTN